jgi:hypothetical protein
VQVEEQPFEEGAPDSQAELERLREEVRTLNERLSEQQEKAEHIQKQIGEFCEAFPSTELKSVPEDVWESVRSGNSLAAAYALYTHRIQQKEARINEQNQKNAYRSAGYVGKSAANEIIEYVLTEPKEAPENTNKWVAGTITEIGEDYFKINDAPMMENEDDGIEFTVNTTDIKILRYFKSGVLRVGDTAIVKYNGNIYADRPTIINGAYSIDECHIYEGEAYIPE